jgi:hypothetical protein
MFHETLDRFLLTWKMELVTNATPRSMPHHGYLLGVCDNSPSQPGCGTFYGTQEAMSNKVIQEIEADIEHYRNAIQDEPNAPPEDVRAWRHELFIARQKLIYAKKMAV